MKNMDSKIIYFKIENQNCIEKGYVEIYDDDFYMPDWYYWKSGQGYVQQEIVEHKREEITGLTDNQYNDIEEFKNLVNNKYVDWVQEYIFMSEEDEKDFLQIGDILKITVGEE